ncbi:MAG: hypothetical protein IJQ67_00195 [Bacilli bacterium]|nr:hypothetical protein [Bacilli bacterium]
MGKKHYVIVSITLGAIAAISAVLIGVTNLVTKDRIIQNEKNRIAAGIKEIFGNNSLISDEEDLKDNGYAYVNYSYTVKANDEFFGYALRTTGSNMYGKISLLVGFGMTYSFSGIYVIINEQTYASTLEDNYLIPLNEGSKELDDVECGATYGAKLVRDMINEASEVILEIWK